MYWEFLFVCVYSTHSGLVIPCVAFGCVPKNFSVWIECLKGNKGNMAIMVVDFKPLLDSTPIPPAHLTIPFPDQDPRIQTTWDHLVWASPAAGDRRESVGGSSLVHQDSTYTLHFFNLGYVAYGKTEEEMCSDGCRLCCNEVDTA